MKKKILAFWLAVILTALAVVACSPAAGPSVDTEETKAAETVAQTEPETEAPTTKWGNNPIDLRFDGKEFKIATYLDGNLSEGWACYFDIDEPEQSDTMQVASFNRNTKIEEDFGVEITCDEPWNWWGGSEGYLYMITLLDSGDTTYQLFFLESYINLALLVIDERLYDIGSLPYLNLEADYYNHAYNDLCRLGTKYLTIASDMTYPCQSAVRLYVNKQRLTDVFGDESYIYNFVDSGDWVFDKMFEVVTGQNEDVNHDNVMDGNDYYGFAGHPDSWCYMFPSSGLRGTYLTDTGFEFDYGTQKAVDVVDKIAEFVTKPEVRVKEWSDASIFFNGNSLFTMSGSELRELRYKETTFGVGVVPFPKFDDEQEHYYAYGAGGGLVVPVNLDEPELTGAMIEAMSYGSHEYLVPAFYETFVQQKVLQDDKSKEYWSKMMSDWNFREFTQVFAPIEDIRFYGPAFKMINRISTGGTNTYSSYWDQISESMRLICDQFYISFMSD